MYSNHFNTTCGVTTKKLHKILCDWSVCESSTMIFLTDVSKKIHDKFVHGEDADFDEFAIVSKRLVAKTIHLRVAYTVRKKDENGTSVMEATETLLLGPFEMDVLKLVQARIAVFEETMLLGAIEVGIRDSNQALYKLGDVNMFFGPSESADYPNPLYMLEKIKAVQVPITQKILSLEDELVQYISLLESEKEAVENRLDDATEHLESLSK